MAIYLGYDRVGIVKTVKVKVFANTTTVSGTYSVVLNNSIGDEVDQLVIDGNSVQSGTPTPETPVEIQSVGNKTKNLFDKDNANIFNGTMSNGVYTANTTSAMIYIPCEDNTTYTISRLAGNSFTVCCSIQEPANGVSYSINNGASTFVNFTSSATTGTYTTVTGAKYLSVLIIGSAAKYTREELMASLQIEKGETATDYEPYGYKIPIIAKGENMVDMSKNPNENSSSYTYINGVYTVSNSQAYRPNRWKVTLKPNTKYVVTAKNINASKCFVQISGYLSGTGIVGGSINLRDYSLTNTFTTTDNGAITLSIYTSELVESLIVEDVQIREVLYTKNIYLKEPLRKIGNFADILDYKNSKVIRKIGSDFIDTVEFMSGDATTYKKFLSNLKHKPYVISSSASYLGYAISNKFKQATVTYSQQGNYPNLIQTYITTTRANRCVYTFGDNSINTIAKAQPLIADGFEVCYVMADTIEEQIDFPMILTRDVETNLEVDTETRPTKLEVSYWEEIK